MRIESTDRYEYRKDLYDSTAELLGENARSKGLDTACWFTKEILRNLEEAVEHEDMTPELAEILSTKHVAVEVEEHRETFVGPNEESRN